MKEFTLKVAQSGIAAGVAFLVDALAEADVAIAGDKEAEITRLDSAVDSLDAELACAAGMADGETADIFQMERMLLNDGDFIDGVRSLIRSEGISAASAVETIGKELAEEIRSNGNELIGERAEEIMGLTGRLVALLGGQDQHALKTPSIIVANELSPAQLSALDPQLILGMVTAHGAPTTHVAIIAGNLGIPYLYGSEEAVASIDASTRLVLDKGKLTVDPDENVYREAVRAMEDAKDARQREAESAREGTTRTKVYANIAGTQDIDALVASGAEGVGLFRTEFLFLGRSSAPSEEEQFEAYRSVAEAMDGKETVIRTIDVGSDKRADYLGLPEERNPALGCRGLRVSLQDEDLFRTQIRALLRSAAYGNVKIMVPMVASTWEVDAVRSKMEECAKELAAEELEFKIPPLGVMVETPAAVMIADQLAQKADFFSIGTNDLTQYTLALDREAQGLEQYYNPFHDAVLRLIEMTAAAGHERGIPTAVCGELASNPMAVEKLIERGVDELSVSVPKVDATKAHVIEAEEHLSQVDAIQDAMPSETVCIAAPADGRIVPMESIPDAAFSSGALGECVGIMPENGNVYAPCDGIVMGVAETKHAITFTSTDGSKILVHAGIDTVTLGGKGFEVLVQAKDAVKIGDLVLTMDLDVIRQAGLSPMVITSHCV